MKADRKSYPLRVSPELLEKFKYVARYDGRSANAQLTLYMREYVRRFEERHGEIALETQENKRG